MGNLYKCMGYTHVQGPVIVGPLIAGVVQPTPSSLSFSPHQHHPLLYTMPSSPQIFTTPFTKLFNIQHPISLAGKRLSHSLSLSLCRHLNPVSFPRAFAVAGMNVAAGPELAAAVSNAGGIGVIGGLGAVFFYSLRSR